MNKHLYLLRHAEAETKTQRSKTDYERELTEKGKNEALLMGNVLKHDHLVPDFILVSAAQRTRTTCEQLLHGMGKNDVEIKFLKSIYHAEPEELLQLISEQGKSFNNLMIIGHNPTIPLFIEYLSGYHCNQYSTCGFTSLSFPHEDWAFSSKNSFQFSSYKEPAMYS